METESFTYKVAGENKLFTYSNNEHILKDIALILYMFSSRGTSWDHLKSKSREEFQTIMTWLEEKYDIDTTKRAPGPSVGPEVVIVSRIAACFDLKVYEFFDKGHGRILFPQNEIEIANPAKSIFCGSFTSLIPINDPNTRVLHYISFLTHYLNDRVLHADTGKYTKFRQMLTYYKAAHNSVAVPNSARLKYLTSVQVLGKNNALKDVYKVAARKCKAKLAEKLASDADCNVFKKQDKKFIINIMIWNKLFIKPLSL